MNSTLDFQRTVTRIALAACYDAGFALAGGSALREHGLSTRRTEDIDLFTITADTSRFAAAVDAVRDSLASHSITATISRKFDTFASLDIVAPNNMSTTLDMGLDWREHPVVDLDIGPVIAEADAVANKTLAVFGRAYARDFIDLASIVSSGRYSANDLMELAHRHDPGFTPRYFHPALESIHRVPSDSWQKYGLSASQWEEVVATIDDLARRVRTHDKDLLKESFLDSLHTAAATWIPEHRIDPSATHTDTETTQPPHSESPDLEP